MNENIKLAKIERRKILPAMPKFNMESAEKVRAFHRTWPDYEITPLVSLKNLAENFNVAGLYVKDESFRFGLNAFKSLGGSYCLGKYIAEKFALQNFTYDAVKNSSPEKITFVTATDGNHGRGIAWSANKLGHNAVVYMPAGTVQERLANIQKLGADASITSMNYDATVQFASENAKKFGWVLVQDTAFSDYKKIPDWIMQGYLTMAHEALEQLGENRPTHIFLQAGVGSMAAAVAAFFSQIYEDYRPIITIVEPNSADCIFRTAQADDGRLHAVTGEMRTIMAGLACGVPSVTAWKILRDTAEFYISMPDYVAANGMRILGNPLAGDTKIISGESGASTFGFVCEAVKDKFLREQLKISPASKILCFSTEGDTDRENYRRIVWEGAFNKFSTASCIS